MDHKTGHLAEDKHPVTNTIKLKNIEQLLIGNGSRDFNTLEKRLAYFCPFEAIGMVRQEIRHGHFLSFLLAPNETHPFGDLFLRTLLFEIADQFTVDQSIVNQMDLHFMNSPKAIVYRERWNIDILVEIPSSSFEKEDKGLVVVIELKIDASESKDQLSKYRTRVLEEYDETKWRHCFVFLTPHAADPSENNATYWTPVSLIDTLTRFDNSLDSTTHTGRAIELYNEYSAMVRRNLLEDQELATVAKRIWLKHRKALETLYEYWPDLQAEILEWIKNNPKFVTEFLDKETGFQIIPDTHSPRILRFAVKKWLEVDGFCDGDVNWVKSSSMMVIEVGDWGDGRLRASIVLGPSTVGPEIREAIYKKVLESVDDKKIKIGRKTATAKNNWKHLSSADIQQKHDYSRAEIDDIPAEDLAKRAMKKFAKFLSKNLPEYDKIVRDTFESNK